MIYGIVPLVNHKCFMEIISKKKKTKSRFDRFELAYNNLYNVFYWIDSFSPTPNKINSPLLRDKRSIKDLKYTN